MKKGYIPRKYPQLSIVSLLFAFTAIILSISACGRQCESQYAREIRRTKEAQEIIQEEIKRKQENEQKQEEILKRVEAENESARIAYLRMPNGKFAPGLVSKDEKIFYKWKVPPIDYDELPISDFHSPLAYPYPNSEMQVIEVDIPEKYKTDTTYWKKTIK